MPDPTRTLADHPPSPAPTPHGPPASAGTDDPDNTRPGWGGPAAAGPFRLPAPAGRYELLDEIARGGMGVVYRAADPGLGREVAVKVLAARYAPGSGAARRFVDEARITARLAHPGIPPVHDVGTLPDGRPFLAMKLIDGRTLDDLLTSSREGEAPAEPAKPHGRRLGGSVALPEANLVAVFEGICQAVGYAHSRGVIHRDLKPGNVMVGAFGEVQVMDWGLAKELGGAAAFGPPAGPRPDLPPTVLHAVAGVTPAVETAAGSVMGTPAFMPPEQAAGDIDRVDRRADVFGLGAILTVILTGEPPYTGDETAAVRQQAARGELGGCLERLGRSGADPGLVALCLRCLSPDPAGRPADAGAVAAEVARLRGEAEGRARAAERDRHAAEVREAEQARRRRAVQWAAGAVGVVLALGVAGTTAGLVRARSAREAEAGQKRVAEQKAAEAEATVKFFEDHILAAARPKGQNGGLGKDATIREAVTAAAPVLAGGFKDQPLVEARLRVTLGGTFYALGDAAAAAAHQERARDLHAAHLGAEDPETLRTLNNLANSYADSGRGPEALRLLEEVLAAQKRVLPPDEPETVRTMNNLAISYAEAGRLGDSVRTFEEALAARRRFLPPDHPDVLVSMSNLASVYADTGREDDAFGLRREVLAARRRVLPPDHPETLTELNNLALSYTDRGRPADALALAREARAGYVRALPADHPDALANLWNLAGILVDLGRGPEALPLIDDCLARAAGRPLNPKMVPDLVRLRLRHFRAAGDPDGCRATAARWEGLNRTEVAGLLTAARMRAVAAGVYTEKGQPAEAAADAEQAMGWLRQAAAAGRVDRGAVDGHDDFAALRTRADFWELVGRLAYLAPPPREAGR